MTNYPSWKSGKSSPLLKLCRQLRIPVDSLNLLPQSHSRITFGSESLQFDNNFEFFLSQVEEKFPRERDRFRTLLAKMEAFPAYSVDAEELSTRDILKESIRDPLLSEMLLCPTCYYGSARKNDIDFPTFVMLFDAIFKHVPGEHGVRSLRRDLLAGLHPESHRLSRRFDLRRLRRRRDRRGAEHTQTPDEQRGAQQASNDGGFP